MKEARLAYVAGLIDADGSLYISRSMNKQGYVQYDPIVMVRTTHKPTAKWLVSKFGGSFDTGRWDNPAWKNYHRWKFTSDVHASRFLDKVVPYLWLKKQQGCNLQKYYALAGKYDKAAREELYRNTSQLNQNESVTTNTSRFTLSGNTAHAYIAGLFDGEGSAYVIRVKQGQSNGSYYRACTSLAMTSKKAIIRLVSMYGGNWRERPPHNGNLPMYEWDIKHNIGKENFLLSIVPYLVTKVEQSKIVLTFSRMRGEVNPEKRKELWLRCSALNGK